MSNINRYSKEIELLCSTGHRTAEQVHKEMKKTYPFIGIGSVYRNLTTLVEAGVLMKTVGVSEKVLYEKNKGPHGHLFCHTSGTIIDIDISLIDFSGLPIPEGFCVDHIIVAMHGNFMNEASCKVAIKSSRNVAK